MSLDASVPVMIVGAGPTGLTLACDLARRGVRCRVVEAASEPFSGSRAKGLMPRTLEVLEDLGVIQDVLESGGPFPPFRGYAGGDVIWDRSIYEMAGFPRLEATPDLPYSDFWMLPQWKTCEILRDRLIELGGRVELETELKAFSQNEEGVIATLSRRGQVERVHSSYLVGTDGGRSFVRKELGVSFFGESDESDRSIIADVKAKGPDREHWHMWTNPTAPNNRVSLCPLPGTDVFQFVAPVAAEETPELHLQALQKIFDERSGRSDVRLSDLSWATLYRVNIRLAERFRTGRVFLAGDAAHVHYPAGGQGLNTGIQDAYNLGWKLGAVLNGAQETLLDSYEDERLSVAENVLGFTSKLRQQGFQAPAAKGKASSHEVFQLAINYRGGPLSRNEGNSSERIQAGDRAPDAPCHQADGESTRLFHLFRGPQFTLLAFGENSETAVIEINDRYAGVVNAFRVLPLGTRPERDHHLLDTGGYIVNGYDIQGEALILVRPDGYVGSVAETNNTEPVHDYLASIVGS